MKIVNGNELDAMAYPGMLFARLDPRFDNPQPEPLIMVLTTMKASESESGRNFICRTDDGLVESAENYQGLPEGFNAPLAICWGTSSVGCYDKCEKFIVLDDDDVECLIYKLQNRKRIEEVLKG